jgi:hypothetical protein
MPHFTRNFVETGRGGRLSMQHYRKKVLTPAVRVDGPFTVETRNGTLTCEDGYLAVDAHGWPYPIDKDEFERIYEKAD